MSFQMTLHSCKMDPFHLTVYQISRPSAAHNLRRTHTRAASRPGCFVKMRTHLGYRAANVRKGSSSCNVANGPPLGLAAQGQAHLRARCFETLGRCFFGVVHEPSSVGVVFPLLLYPSQQPKRGRTTLSRARRAAASQCQSPPPMTTE